MIIIEEAAKIRCFHSKAAKRDPPQPKKPKISRKDAKVKTKFATRTS
jgi:hypothetical protein